MVGMQIGQDPVEPFPTFLVGGLIGYHTQGIQVSPMVLLDPIHQYRIGRIEIGVFHAGQIEGLADGIKADTVIHHRLVRQTGKGHITMAGAHDIGVNLIGQHHDALVQTQATNAKQFLFGPDIAGGVLGVTDDHGIDVRGHLRLQILPVNFIAATPKYQRTVHGIHACVVTVIIETGVNGR